MKVCRFIDVHVPIELCNLKCSYCYVSQYHNNLDKKIVKGLFKYTPEEVKKALSVERLGGVCHFNICGAGETLISEDLIAYIKAILENGHSIMIVTNGTLTQRFKAMTEFPLELRKRLGFKFSFHYLELKKRNLLKVFFDNIKMMRKAGCSFSLELTAADVYEPYIDEIKEICLKEVGALCHLSIPRNEPEKGIPLLSKHNLEDFYNVWKDFDSAMFNNKVKFWGQKRKEYCYAGYYTSLLNLGNGEMMPCYNCRSRTQNIFENPDKKIDWCPVGKCRVDHCFNAHAFLAFGDIPSVDFCTYEQVRDRIDKDGNHWLTEEMREHLGYKLYDNNKEFNNLPPSKFKTKFKNTNLRLKHFLCRVKRKLFKKKDGNNCK